MSEEETTVDPAVTESYVDQVEDSDSPDWAAVRSKERKLKAEVKEWQERAETAELERDQLKVQAAGFTDVQAKHVAQAVAEGLVDADDPEALWRHAESEFGWEKPKMTLLEQYVHADAERLRRLESVTTSDMPPGVERDIADAEAAGNFELSRALKSGKLATAIQQGG